PPRRGTRRGRQTSRLRRIVLRVREYIDAAQARGHGAEPAVAIRAAETRGGAILPDVHATLRVRDRDDPLLQRIRPAPGSRLTVFGRDLALFDGAARRAAA